MDILEIAKRKVVGNAEENNAVVVTDNGNFICE